MHNEQVGRSGAFIRLASRPIPRISRMMSVAGDLGYQCLFIGAFREANLPESDTWEALKVKRVGGYFPLLNGKRVFLYLISVLRFWWGTLKELFQLRPAFVHASDFEAAVPGALYCRLFQRPLVYNIHDNLAIRHRVPYGISGILNVFEALMVRLSTISIVPEHFRTELLPKWCHSRVVVVRNTPVDPGFSPPPPIATKPKVMFAGWLDTGRGLRELLTLASAGEIELVLAGEGDAEIAERASATPNVHFLGFLPHGEVMKETALCHFVAAFYDPARPINRFAASNKVAEALAIGRPVLVNSEMRVSPELDATNCAVVVPYSGIEQLGRTLSDLLSDRDRYLHMCQRARWHYECEYDWKKVKEASMQAFLAAGIVK